MNLTLISFEKYYFLAVFDILLMDVIQPISQLKSNFTFFFQNKVSRALCEDFKELYTMIVSDLDSVTRSVDMSLQSLPSRNLITSVSFLPEMAAITDFFVFNRNFVYFNSKIKLVSGRYPKKMVMS